MCVFVCANYRWGRGVRERGSEVRVRQNVENGKTLKIGKWVQRLLRCPLCDIPSGCCSFTGPWTVTCSSLRILRQVAAFCRPLLLLPPMRMLPHPLRSGFLFPLSWLSPCLPHLPSSLLLCLPRSVWLCCSSPCLLALLGAPCAHPLLHHPPAAPARGFHVSAGR